MISKAFILLIALSYVHSSPLINSPDNNLPTDSKIPDTINNNNNNEEKLTRIARNNKVEYVYVNADGEIINSKQGIFPKITPRVDDTFISSVSDKVVEKNYLREKDSLNSKNLVSNPTDEKLDSSDSLHYASGGGMKIRQESLKSRSNAVPGNLAQQSSPLTPQSSIYPAYDYLQNYQNYYPSPSLISPLIAPISSPYNYPINYPLLLNQAYNPLFSNLYSRYANVIPDDLEIRRLGHSNLDLIPSLISSLPYLFQRFTSPLSIGSYLFGRQLNSLLYSPNLFTGTPYINPLLSYLLPQQTPNLNYLTTRSLIGLNGYDSLYNNNYSPYYQSSLINNLLYPGLAQNYYPNLYPQYGGVFQPYLNYPFPNNQQQQSLIPTSQLAQPAADPFAGRRVSTTSPPATTTTTVSSSSSADAPATVINPFSDSVVSVSNSPSVIVPGHVESDIEKPLLYSNIQNTASLRSPIYDSTLLHGNYLNSPYYNRLIDPITGLPYRYPAAYSSGYYSRLSNYYQPGYSSIYRPGFISTYPPYNGVTGYPYSSIMHYSADPSILGRSAVSKEDDSKATAPKEEGKSNNNLMYTIKTSKSESKETVSRLNPHEAPKLNLDDKKA